MRGTQKRCGAGSLQNPTPLEPQPLITEKSSVISEEQNRYGFVVHAKANKYQVKDAIQKLYDVEVLNVKTSTLPGKIKRFGAKVKKTGKVKRAFVQLGEGQKIEFFKGV